MNLKAKKGYWYLAILFALFFFVINLFSLGNMGISLVAGAIIGYGIVRIIQINKRMKEEDLRNIIESEERKEVNKEDMSEFVSLKEIEKNMGKEDKE